MTQVGTARPLSCVIKIGDEISISEPDTLKLEVDGVLWVRLTGQATKTMTAEDWVEYIPAPRAYVWP